MRSLREFPDSRWGLVLLSYDTAAGVLIGSAVAVSAALVPKLQEPHIFDLTAGVSVAILAVVIAAFAILVAFLTDEYTLVVKEALGSPRAAFEPYAVVASVAGAAILASGAGIFLWAVCPSWLRAVLMGLATGLTTWSVLGTVQLVGITITHGRHKAMVPEIRATHEKVKREAQKGGSR
jgi:hypothetical protein